LNKAGAVFIRNMRRERPAANAASGALSFLTAMGLFLGQSPAFFVFMGELAAAANAARRQID
jgi:hypothetical protein